MFGGALITKAFGWLTGNVIGAITAPFVKMYEIKTATSLNKLKIKSDIAHSLIESDMQVSQNVKEIRLATANFLEMRILTFCAGFPFVFHAGAVGIDTTLKMGWGIPAYPEPFNQWEGQIILSLFGLQVGVTAVRAVAWAFAKGK